MHPLTLMVVGVYGKELPNQNGAPLRLVTPWKYGFKGIKSIVEIEFTKRQPGTSWERLRTPGIWFLCQCKPGSQIIHAGARPENAGLAQALFAEKQPTP